MSSPLSDTPASSPGSDQLAEDTAGTSQPEGTEPPAANADPASRPVIAVALLAGHPGNVRRDLRLTPEFLASVAASGILVPLRVTPAGDGRYRVIDGHRRLAAALRVGLTEVPADIAPERASDDAGQFLDMFTTHRQRDPLSGFEEADALFSAEQAGATRTRIRKDTGLKAAEVKAALAAARITPQNRQALEEADYPLDLDQLAVIAEFQDDPEAVTQLAAAAWNGRGFDHTAEQLRQQRADQAEHDRRRTELTAAGYAVTDILPPGAQRLNRLLHDGAELTDEQHADCPGRGVFFNGWDPLTPQHYCTDPSAHGHTSRYDQALSLSLPPPAGVPGSSEPGAAQPDPARRLVIEGNRAWKAAAEVRRRWLAGSLLTRRTAPREAVQFAARQLLTMPEPLHSGLPDAPRREAFRQFTGHTSEALLDSCTTGTAGRLPLLILAPIVTAYEHAMTEGEGRNTWRTDRYSPCPRAQASGYLTFLASLGYELSAIEQAVSDGTPYTGETPADGLLYEDKDTAAEPGPGVPAATGDADAAGDSADIQPDDTAATTSQAA
jgi:ParB family transcriptional regulator, chromosome partitioning protein